MSPGCYWGFSTKETETLSQVEQREGPRMADVLFHFLRASPAWWDLWVVMGRAEEEDMKGALLYLTW